MVVFHGRCGVDRRQRRGSVQHELVVLAPVVQIMAQRPHEQRQHLQWFKSVFGPFEDGVHAIGNVESVGPVVVRHPAVILLDGQHETDERVTFETRQTEEVNEHENGTVDLFHVVETERIEPELVDAHRCVSGVW